MTDFERSQDAPAPTLGNYRLVAPLGSGGMSSVYRAVHERTGHEVAIKVLPRYLAKNPVLLQRFLREAQNAGALQDPNIVALYESGCDGGRHYLVLEYVPGSDLHDRVQFDGPLPVADAIEVIRQVSSGLKHASGKGLIHRDIKPANILMTPEGKVKIIDLGLALQVEGEEDERVTRDGTTVGTVDFMSPEQARDSRATSVRSDIYSLGCTLYYLLTGSAPYPGGDVPDRLRRHAKESPPDARAMRPEISEPLAQLIQRMMAKRPERRFNDYDELIAALDSLPSPGTAADQEPVFALVDTDEDDDGETDEGFSLEGEVPQMAKGPTIETAARQADDEAPGGPGINLAALGGIEDEDRPVRAPSKPSLEKAEDLDWAMEEVADDPGSDEGVEEPLPTFLGSPQSQAGMAGFPLKTWIIGCSLVGLAFILLLVGIRGLRSASSDSSELDEEPVIEAGVEPEPEPIVEPAPPEVASVKPPAITPPPKAVARPRPSISPEPKAPNPVVATSPPVFVEPEDQAPSIVPEEPFPLEIETSFRPVVGNIDAPAEAQITTVRRLGPTSLTLEVGKVQGTVEVSGNGPYFEDNLSIAGQSRLIRAARGFRPIVVLEPPQTDEARKRPGVFVLDRKRVTIEGLDLVVDVASRPETQGALFLCRSTELTLRDCTITLIGPEEVPFALVRIEDPNGTGRPSGIKLERTLVRGRGVTAIDLGQAAANVDVSRSVLICGRGAVRSAGGEAGTGRAVSQTVRLYRSLCASRESLVGVANLPSPEKGVRLQIQALGSTLVHLGGSTVESLIAGPDARGRPPREIISWRGDYNVFVGWPGWLRSRSGGDLAVALLADAQTAWDQTDPHSREQTQGWGLAQDADRIGPEDLMSVVASCGPILTRVAHPSPNLRPKTVESFARLTIGDPAAPPQAPAPNPGAAPGPPVARENPPALPEGTEIFDVTKPPWVGDLGRFVADRFAAGAKTLRIVARGGGLFEMTPVRLPDGSSLTIAVDPPATEATPPLVWKPSEAAEGEALIDAQRANVSLSGVRLMRDAATKVKHLIRAEDGQLVLSGCHLTAPGGMSPPGAMVAFRAAGSRPLPSGPRAPYPSSDRPVCRMVDCLILTGGDVLSAEVARGVVALENCAIACGGRAVWLRPQKVRRDLFEADLWLDRCTIASERAFVELGRWDGWNGGPDRPWLISSRRCAFVDAFARNLQQSPMLLVDAEAFVRGVVFWQSERDSYEVARFAATELAFVPKPRGPDVRREWIEFWGRNHTLNVQGPVPGDREPIVRLAGDRLRLATLVPQELALIPDLRPGRLTQEIGADLSRLNLPPASRGAVRVTPRVGP